MLWLATWAGQNGAILHPRDCPLYPPRELVLATMLKIYFWPSLCCLVKMARYWPRPFFAFYKHAINMSLASRCKSRTWPISNPSWLHACSIINTEESEENMRGRSSIQYKIKVQSWMKGQIVIFQDCSNVIWQWLPDDIYFPNLPKDFKRLTLGLGKQKSVWNSGEFEIADNKI